MTIRSFLPLPVAVSALLPLASLTAQTSLSVGGGVTLAKVQVSPNQPDFTLDNRMGFTVGASMNMPLSRAVDLQLGGAYIQKGYRVGDETFDGDAKLDYFELTALARPSASMDGGMSFHLLGGPALGVSMGCSFTSGEGTGECSDGVTSLDLGVLVGAGVQMSSLRVDGAYTLGIMNVDETDDGQDSVKNRSMSIQVAYVIPIGGS